MAALALAIFLHTLSAVIQFKAYMCSSHHPHHHFYFQGTAVMTGKGWGWGRRENNQADFFQLHKGQVAKREEETKGNRISYQERAKVKKIHSTTPSACFECALAFLLALAYTID